MKRDSSHGRNHLADFLLLPPAATVISLGMILPEYWLILVFAAFFGKTILVIVQRSTAAMIWQTPAGLPAGESDSLALQPRKVAGILSTLSSCD